MGGWQVAGVPGTVSGAQAIAHWGRCAISEPSPQFLAPGTPAARPPEVCPPPPGTCSAQHGSQPRMSAPLLHPQRRHARSLVVSAPVRGETPAGPRHRCHVSPAAAALQPRRSCTGSPRRAGRQLPDLAQRWASTAVAQEQASSRKASGRASAAAGGPPAPPASCATTKRSLRMPSYIPSAMPALPVALQQSFPSPPPS